MIAARKIILLSAFIAISITGIGQNVFEAVYSTSADDAPAGAASLSTGYVVAVNQSVHPEQTPIHKANLLLFDHFGVLQDSTVLTVTNARVWIEEVLVDGDELIIVANFVDTLASDFNVMLYRFDNALNELDAQAIGTPICNEHAYSAIVAANGNLLIAGGYANGTLPDSLFLLEFDNTFSTVNELNINAVPAFDVGIVDNSAAGKYILLADNAIVSVNSAAFEYDTTHLVNGNFVSLSYGKAITSDTYLRFGASIRSGSTMNNPSDWQLTAYEVSASSASHIDTLHCGFNDYSDYPAVKGLDFQTPDSLFFTGMKDYYVPTQTFFQSANWGVELWCTDATGTPHWQTEFGGDALYWVHQVLATPDGGALVISSTWDWQNNPDEERDLHVMKVDAQGNIATGVDKQFSADSFAIIYPNPTSSTATLQFEGNTRASVSIYNIFGQLLDHFSVTSRSIEIDFHSYATGNYLILVSDEKSAQSLKVSVVK